MKTLNKVITLLLVLILSSGHVLLVFADNNSEDYLEPVAKKHIINLYTPGDILTLSKHCVLDSYSKDKMVFLMNDINLSNYPNLIIPSFSGVFEGNGHKISGLMIDKEGSDLGLFRYNEKNGIIKNLVVEGLVQPQGTKNEIGGLVGTNYGVIKNVLFKGNITGKNNVGGLVGFNKESGVVDGGRFDGQVLGEHQTGGIVGNNLGKVKNSTNYGEVNTSLVNGADVRNPDINIEEDSLEIGEKPDVMSSFTDTGGIVGLNEGLVSYCINKGEVGYTHFGYNIGGLVGRQKGYLSNSKNYAKIYGRKDVGGLVGQLEPKIDLMFSPDTLKTLNDELSLLSSSIEKTIDDSEASNKDVIDSLDEVNTLTKETSDKLETLMTNLSNYTEDTSDNLNIGLTRVRDFIADLEPVIENFADANKSIRNGMAEIELALKEFSKGSQAFSESLKDMEKGLEDLEKASREMSTGFSLMATSAKLLGEAAKSSPEYIMGKDQFFHGLDSYNKAFIETSEATRNVIDAYENIGAPTTSESINAAVDVMRAISNNMFTPEMESATTNINSGAKAIRKEIESDMVLVQESMSLMVFVASSFKSMSDYMTMAMEDLNLAGDDITESVDFMTSGFDKLSNGTAKLKTAFDDIAKGMDKLEVSISKINQQERIQFSKLSDFTGNSGEEFFEAFRQISTGITKLNSNLGDYSTSLNKNLRILNSRMSRVREVLKEGMDNMTFDGKDLFQDMSDTLVVDENKKDKGRVYTVENFGLVNGDVNVGGIIGSMGIEYDLDPEQDIKSSGDRSFNFKYQTRSVLKAAINRGTVQGKKNHIGGIVGKMDLGLVLDCENYSIVETDDGNYIGGIAGYSSSSIKRSYSLSELKGVNYIGGIAGYATVVEESYAMVNILSSNEFSGAIGGNYEGNYKNNYFVASGNAGVDGISYSEKAIPMSHSEFVNLANMKDEFKQVEVMFIADDIVLNRVKVDYGGQISKDQFPTIPDKYGDFGYWEETSLNNLIFTKRINVVYEPLITVLASEEEVNNKAKVLVEGIFGQDGSLDVSVIENHLVKDDELMIESLEIKLQSDVDNGSYRYRILAPDDNVDLYEVSEDGLSKIEIIKDGSYLVFESSKIELSIMVKKILDKSTLILGLMIILILCLSMVVVLKIKKRKKI